MTQRGYFLEELELGMSESYTRVVSEEDIQQFATVSGDHNPVHLDDDFASTTRFKKRIAHGMLSASFISTVVGTRLPGNGCIYVSQTLKFRAPVYIGDTVVTKLSVTHIDERKGFVTLKSICTVDSTDVIRGEAVMLVSKREG